MAASGFTMGAQSFESSNLPGQAGNRVYGEDDDELNELNQLLADSNDFSVSGGGAGRSLAGEQNTSGGDEPCFQVYYK